MRSAHSHAWRFLASLASVVSISVACGDSVPPTLETDAGPCCGDGGPAVDGARLDAGLADDAAPGDAGRSGSSVSFPARAAFYYPWYPETWTVGGAHVSYEPALGYYDSSDASVIETHVAALVHAKVQVAIFSWWGPGTHEEATRVGALLDRTTLAGHPLAWAAYYEKEGFADVPIEELRADLEALRATHASDPAYAHVDGRPLLFVYNADDVDCVVVDKWAELFSDWYVVLKVFSGFASCDAQPASWHQYALANATQHQAGYSYSISPGFWRADEAEPRLARDLDRWRQNVREMVASGEPWQLITTFNEWGEGTAVEEASAWTSPEHGAYLDALHDDGM